MNAHPMYLYNWNWVKILIFPDTATNMPGVCKIQFTSGTTQWVLSADVKWYYVS